MPSVIIYARVSTEDGQDPAAQVRTCRVYADLRGYTVQQVYEDRASALNFRGRKAWRTMLEDLKRWAPRTRPKGILAYALDRVARSLMDYVNITEQLKELGVDLVTVDGTLGELGEGGDPYREAMAGFLAVFAELERKVIVRRTRDGIANAQAKGVKFGRPRRSIDWTAWGELPEGLSLRQRAQFLGVPPATLRTAEKRRAEKGVLPGGSSQLAATRPTPADSKPFPFASPPDDTEYGTEEEA